MKEKAMEDYMIWDEASQSYVMDPEQKVRDEVEKNHWKNVGKNLLKDWRLYLMLVPMILVFFLWRYMPMYELLGCFKLSDSTPVIEQNFVGFSNFLNLISGGKSVEFWRAFRNTFLLSFYGLCFGFPVPIILALFFNEVKSNIARSVFQVFTYLPKFMSTVVITSLTLMLLQGSSVSTGVVQPGIIAQLLVKMGAITQNVADLGVMNNPLYFRAVYQITGIWEGAGYDSIVFFAAIIAISPTSYEAAQIDGAGKMAQMRYVVLPSILSTIVIMLIIRIGSLLSIGYEKVYLLYNQNTWETADVVSTFAMKLGNVGVSSGSTSSMPGMASAAEMLNNITGMLLVIGANLISKKASNVSLY